MQTVYFFIIAGCWALFLLYWLISSFDVKQDVKNPNTIRNFFIWLFMCLSFILLFYQRLTGFLAIQVIPVALSALGLVAVFGFAFAVWSRVALGKNWSAKSVIKRDHELIQTGPYAVTRHPIYTGWLVAYIGTVIALGEVRALLGLLCLIAAFAIKIRQEEEMMEKEFPQKYPGYKRRVKTIIPWIY